ncbi:hypothetical protein BJV82DRAFT_361242 [Fennellomyces sp. T-0311]|nr:hypothetical protein BJV82DRAFT_361242 [Fennellomyces sp. T-0311]
MKLPVGLALLFFLVGLSKPVASDTVCTTTGDQHVLRQCCQNDPRVMDGGLRYYASENACHIEPYMAVYPNNTGSFPKSARDQLHDCSAQRSLRIRCQD